MLENYLSRDGRVLDLRDSDITSLQGITLPPKLRKLSLRDSNVTSLDGVVLPQGMKELDLSYTLLTSLEGVVFPRQLQKLDLGFSTRLMGLDGVQFPQKLRELDLRGTELPSLEGIVLPSGLQKLNLSFNRDLESIEGLELPQGLQVLDLHNTNLETLDGVELPQELQELNLNDTKLSNLDHVILPPKLNVLDLSYNKNLTSLEGVVLPQSLKKLKVDHTKLADLKGVTLPQGLQELHLTCTKLQDLEGVVLPQELQTLYLSYTPEFTSLGGVKLPEGLKALILSGTSLTSINDIALPQGMQWLYLDHTKLSSLENIALPPALQRLYLNNTNLVSLPTSIRKLQKLRDLTLSELHLTELPDWLPELGLSFTRKQFGDGIRMYKTTVDGVDMSIFDKSQTEIIQWFSTRKNAAGQQSNQPPTDTLLPFSAPVHTSDKARDDLLKDLVHCCEMLQDDRTTWGKSEDDRTTYIRNLLRAKGYIAMDQSRGGVSTGGEQAGELDLDIRREASIRWTIFEALNLSGSTESRLRYWDAHLDKLLDNYNSTGCPFLFHVTYLSCPKEQFVRHCVAFEEHIRRYSPLGFSVISETISLPLERMELHHGQFLQIMECVYDCGGIPMTVYHFFVRIGE